MNVKPDWRKTQDSMQGQLWYMYENRIRTDMSIAVFNGQKRRVFDCHKLMMVRLSSVFETLIYELNDEEEEESCINISAGDPDLFSKIIEFAYKDNLDIEAPADALKLFAMSKSYDIHHLSSICMQYLIENVDRDSIWKILDNLGTISKKEKAKLCKKVDEFLEKNTEDCLESDEFLTCNQSSLLHLLTKNKLNINSELQLILAAIRWCQRQNPGVTLDSTSAQQLLGPCLEHLRFLSLSTAEFSSHVVNSGLISKDDSLAVLINISSPGQSVLPPGLSIIREPRENPVPTNVGDTSTPTGENEKGKKPRFKKAANISKDIKKPPSFTKGPKQAQPRSLKDSSVFSKSNSDLSEKCNVKVLMTTSNRKLVSKLSHISGVAEFKLNMRWCLYGIVIGFPRTGQQPLALAQSRQMFVKLDELQGKTIQTLSVSLKNGAEDLRAPLNFMTPVFLEEGKMYFLEIMFHSPADHYSRPHIASMKVLGGNLSVFIQELI